MIRATAAHAGVMAAIHAAAFPGDPWTAEAFSVLLEQPGVIGLLQAGAAAGMLLLRIAADEAEILTIGVLVPRRGVGRRLMAAALESARAAGAEKMFLEVAAANEPARGLYAALGFAPVGARRGYYRDGGDAVVLSLAL